MILIVVAACRAFDLGSRYVHLRPIPLYAVITERSDGHALGMANLQRSYGRHYTVL